jgi:hypothetical protein
VSMHIELLLVRDCPHVTAAADLVATAVKDTGPNAFISHVTIASDEEARDRGFTGSPTILLDGWDPFVTRGFDWLDLPFVFDPRLRCPSLAGLASGAQKGRRRIGGVSDRHSSRAFRVLPASGSATQGGRERLSFEGAPVTRSTRRAGRSALRWSAVTGHGPSD